MKLEDLREIPGITILDSPSPEELRFSIFTVGAWEDLTIEVSCPLASNGPILSQSKIYRSGGGDVPTCWSKENLEGTLQAKLDTERLKSQVEKDRIQAELKSQILRESLEDLRSEVGQSIEKFIKARSSVSNVGMDGVSDFLTICVQTYVSALEKQNVESTIAGEAATAGDSGPGSAEKS